VTIPTGQTSHAEVEWQLYGDTTLKLYESKNKESEIGSVFLDDGKEWNEGSVAIRSANSTAAALLDEASTTATTANVQSIDVGIDTNVAPNQIRVIKTSITGVESVTNHVATGDDKFLNTDFDPFVTGEQRETDEQLRKRAFDNTSIGGAATATAIGTEIEEIDGVQSVRIFQNKTEGTSNDGLPPHSFEAVVYGGDDQEIAKTIFDTSSIDSTDYGGVHGSESTYTITSDVLAQDETIHWSRPTKVALEITLELIVDDTYVGNDDIRALIASYIGGTDVDGSFVPGVVAGEDVYEAVLKQNITDPSETGVWEVDSLSIDGNGDGTDDTTTTASGAEVYEVTDSEIAQVNARDGSIDITTTTK